MWWVSKSYLLKRVAINLDLPHLKRIEDEGVDVIIYEPSLTTDQFSGARLINEL